MPAQLSGNTLNLKFMQRAAQKRAASAPTPAPSVISAQAEQQIPVKSENASDAPVASTSRAGRAARPSVTTEASYLAFPSLSGSMQAQSWQNTGGMTNGRMSFGKAKGKAKQQASDDDHEMQDVDVDAPPEKRKKKTVENASERPTKTEATKADKADTKAFRKPAAYDDLPVPIRKKQKMQKQEDIDANDEDFTKDMIQKARDRRKALVNGPQM